MVYLNKKSKRGKNSQKFLDNSLDIALGGVLIAVIIAAGGFFLLGYCFARLLKKRDENEKRHKKEA